MVIYLNLYEIETPVSGANVNAQPIFTLTGIEIPPFNISRITMSNKLNEVTISEIGGIWDNEGTPLYNTIKTFVLGMNGKDVKIQCNFGTENNMDFSPYIGYIVDVDTVKSNLNIPIIIQYGKWKINGWNATEEAVKPNMSEFELELGYQWESEQESMLFNVLE